MGWGACKLSGRSSGHLLISWPQTWEVGPLGDVLLYCNTDVVVIKPVTKKEIYVQQGFHTKKKFVSIHIPVIRFRFTQYMQYTAI